MERAGGDRDYSSASEDEIQPQKSSHRRVNSRRESHATRSDKGKENQGDELGPACQACRRKKTKCSRQHPCSYCMQLDIECVYNDRKVKPGMRTGAVENLNQRLVALENMFLGQSVLWKQVWAAISDIQKQASPSDTHPNLVSDDLKECADQFRSTVSNLSNGQARSPSDNLASPTGLKRRRVDTGNYNQSYPIQSSTLALSDDNILPPDNVIDELVTLYVTNIHPWVPMLHVGQFRKRLADTQEKESLKTVIHAIVSITIRFSDNILFKEPNTRQQYIKRNREKVILSSMESFSVESLQALVIIAFDTIGSGRGPSAWSIVGSMTRTVEHLGLSIEEEDENESNQDHPVEFFIQRMAFLASPETWIEKEERRRVFWNVFLMDRFCANATGWNFSLTSADVRRRLPCQSQIWEEGNPLNISTPYFGIADKGSRDIMNSNMATSLRTDDEGQDALGGFAYRIEATETLTLVTIFLLKHPLNVANAHEVQIWMMRFKELDLRLVQWKLFLPEKWREASVYNANGSMDENLTLAHINHNAAVILLHQTIAYPSPQWTQSHIRLPSLSSAETCLAAANEISIIASKYLSSCTAVVAPQFAFSLFIGARNLLSHALHNSTPLPPQFNAIIDSLLEISRRWNGLYPPDSNREEDQDLAAKFASRLIRAREMGHLAATAAQPSLDLRQAIYTEKKNGEIARRKASQSPYHTPPSVTSISAELSQSSRPRADMNSVSGIEGGLEYQEQRSGNAPAQSSKTPFDFQHFPLVSEHWQNNPSGVSGQGMQSASRLRSAPALDSSNARFSEYGQSHNHELDTINEYGDQEVHKFAAGYYGGDLSIAPPGQEFEDLNSFFDNPFLPTQRISTFSGTGNWLERVEKESS